MLSTDDTPDRPTNGSHSLQVVLHRNLALDRAPQEIVEERESHRTRFVRPKSRRLSRTVQPPIVAARRSSPASEPADTNNRRFVASDLRWCRVKECLERKFKYALT